MQVREMGTRTHFLGQSETVAHFGLGVAEGPVAAVRVDWPSGIRQCVTGVTPGATLVVTEPVTQGPRRETCSDRPGRPVPGRRRR